VTHDLFYFPTRSLSQDFSGATHLFGQLDRPPLSYSLKTDVLQEGSPPPSFTRRAVVVREIPFRLVHGLGDFWIT